jgi:hypothetical protein
MAISVTDLIEVFEAAAAAAIIKSQYDLGNDYINLAKNYRDIYARHRNFYYSYFQDGGSDLAHTERGLLFEVFTNPLLPNNQSGTSYQSQYNPQAQDILQFFGTTIMGQGWWIQHANMASTMPFLLGLDSIGNYFIVPTVPGAPYDVDYAASIADYQTYMFRYEEHRKDVYDERTVEWQNQALNFGVKQASIVESGLGTSFKFIDAANNGLADFYAAQANGIIKNIAFRRGYDKDTDHLRAASRIGANLAISPSLGVDIKPSPFMDEEESMTYQSIQR